MREKMSIQLVFQKCTVILQISGSKLMCLNLAFYSWSHIEIPISLGMNPI